MAGSWSAEPRGTTTNSTGRSLGERGAEDPPEEASRPETTFAEPVALPEGFHSASFSVSAAPGLRQICRLESEVKTDGRSGELVGHSLTRNVVCGTVFQRRYRTFGWGGCN